MRFAVFLLSVICLMCSCTDDQERIYGELVPVIFSPSLPGAVEIEASTRVVNNKWSGNEIVGIAPVAAGNNLVANTTIYQYKTSTSDSGSSSVTLTPSSTVLYHQGHCWC